MSQDIINRLRKNRQGRLERDNGKVILFKRPTDMEFVKLQSLEDGQFDVIKRYVTGWEGYTELDLISSGTGESVEFHPLLWAEWIEDHPEEWKPISDAIMGSYTDHQKQMVEDVKKSKPGS